MAARHRNRNARALANLDALIERARSYGVAGLRAFVRDLHADWDCKSRVPEGRIDAAEHAIEIVTIHTAKGLEWPVVIPINSTTALYRSDQFVHRQSDNSLHWMLGGVAPPELDAARAEEHEEESNQRERIWYVACTRARDLLILPYIPQASKVSWFSSIDLRQIDLPELNILDLPNPIARTTVGHDNKQSADVFTAEQRVVEESAPAIVWRRPSDHDQDRLSDQFDIVIVDDAFSERVEVVGAGALRGIILHKLMEEFLTGELETSNAAVASRAATLLLELDQGLDQERPRPDPLEMANTALRNLALPEIVALRPHLVPELAIWAKAADSLVAGRVDALAIKGGRIDVAIDWKSDVNPTPAIRSAYAGQLQQYLMGNSRQTWCARIFEPW
jgi:CRISPR-associated exonuclease Cas4